MSAVYSPLSSATVGGGDIFRGQSGRFAARCRPWRELFGRIASYSVPYSYTEFRSRLDCNLNHFRVNYAMIVLCILFLSLLYHPISMIVFIMVFSLWLVLYFSRAEPIVMCNFAVDDRVVVLGLGVVTIVALGLTRVWVNILASVLISAAAVVVHAAFRVAEDVFRGEDEFGDDGGLVSVVGS